jgi:hypothetical protein
MQSPTVVWEHGITDISVLGGSDGGCHPIIHPSSYIIHLTSHVLSSATHHLFHSVLDHTHIQIVNVLVPCKPAT